MRAQLNRILQSAGLSTLEDPEPLLAQLGFLVRDHEHLRSLLATCEPQERRNMYEALRPNLSFPAKPLDVYMAEVAMDAAARQLPVMGEGGKLLPFQVPEVRSDEAIAQAAVDEQLAKQRIWVCCRKCTREEVFHGNTKANALMALRNAGWTYDEIQGDGREICPDCPAVRVA